MYKIANDKAVRSAARIGLADLARGGLPEIPAEGDERRNLVRVAQGLEVAIKAEPDLRRRKELGIQKLAVQEQIRALKPKQSAQGLPGCFMDAARDLLTKFEYERIKKEAHGRLDAIRALEEQHP